MARVRKATTTAAGHKSEAEWPFLDIYLLGSTKSCDVCNISVYSDTQIDGCLIWCSPAALNSQTAGKTCTSEDCCTGKLQQERGKPSQPRER